MNKMTGITNQLNGNYPTRWSDFVGQDVAKEKLITAARSARLRATRMEHTLLTSGTPGIGKTSLAVLTAIELGGSIRVISGQVKALDARLVLASMEDGDVLFVDEIHQVFSGSKVNGEWLLHLLQDGVILTPRGSEAAPDITVLAATTDAGRLPETILERFSICELVNYTDEEATGIARALSSRMLLSCPEPSDANCAAVARASSNSPRMMSKLWITTRDICMTTEASNWLGEEYDLARSLAWHGLTADGLTKGCQEYLITLFQDCQGSAGLTVLKERLREPGGLGNTERLLLEKGLIRLEKTGREISTAGVKRVNQLLRERSLAA